MLAEKPVTTIPEQIARLRAKGMLVDEAFAARWLTNVSYYRLSAYWYPARIIAPDGTRLGGVSAGTRFEDVVALYEADRKLRTLIHDGLERVEITMRTRIGEVLVESGSLAYTDARIFRPSFDHSRWMETANRRIHRAGSRNQAIVHYRTNYGGRFPFWVLAEVLDFSDISRLFDGLPAKEQRRISEDLGFVIDLTGLSANQRAKVKNHPPLVRWMEQLTVVRNTCAHHGRLWNKSFAPAPTSALRTIEVFSHLPEGQSERLHGALAVMAQILRVASPGTTWPDKVAGLLKNDFLGNPLVNPSSLALPDEWDGTL